MCSECKLEKPSSDFSKCRKSKTGLASKCKLCQKEYSRLYDIKRSTAFDYSDPFYKENKKVCSRCGVEKTLIEFTKDFKGTNGLKVHCNDCRKPYYKKLKDETYNPVVYNIINKTNREVLYVGETTTPELRMNKHFSNYADSPIAYLISTGELNPDNLLFEIIEQVEDKKTRLQRETYWIREKNPKYNIAKKYTIIKV
jgi:hypothetical protein